MRLLYVIPNYTKFKWQINMLEKLLYSIKWHEPHMLKHTLIIDDASTYADTKRELEKLRTQYGFNLLMRSRNEGYSKTVNMGLGLARFKTYDGVVTVNSDIELLTPVHDTFTDIFKQDPTIGIIGGRLLYPTGRVQSAGIDIDSRANVIAHDKFMPMLTNAGPSNDPGFYFIVTGALQAIRLDVGRYSTRYELSYEDVEFCLRAWENDWKVYYTPKVTVIHNESSTRGYFPGAKEVNSFHTFMSDFQRFDYEALHLKLAQARNPPSQPELQHPHQQTLQIPLDF